MNKILSERLQAANLLEQVIYEKKSLTTILQNCDNSYVKALCYEICRWFSYLVVVLKPILRKPLKNKDHDIYLLLLIGIYELWQAQTPDYAVIQQTAEAARINKKPWGVGLINAILRKITRERYIFEKITEQNPNSIYAHPQWLVDKIKNAWPKHWQQILTANNQHAPLSLRINLQKISREDYLKQSQLSARFGEFSPTAILSEKAANVEKLYGFNEGFVHVQDEAAQLAAILLQICSKQRVLDACAAPGGKSLHLLELLPDIELTSVDQDAVRLEKLKKSLQSLKLNANCIAVDANELITKNYFSEKYFDRVLLDAPCSATGVIRRHPDIKWLKTASDIKQLAKQQLQLLTTVWQLLKPQGLLLFCTCSIMPEETWQIIEKFFATITDAKEVVITAKWGHEMKHGRQILPGEHNMDGFYYCLLQRV